VKSRKMSALNILALLAILSPADPPELGPVQARLRCPSCGVRHVDEGNAVPHRTHKCRSCGFLWQPSDHPTVGVV
jgi:rubredoxin